MDTVTVRDSLGNTLIEDQPLVTIDGKEYPVRELPIPGKMRVAEDIFPLIKEFVANQDDGEIKLTAIVDLIAGTIQYIESAVMLLFRLSVPSYEGDWAEIPESRLRAPLKTVLEVNDFGGFGKYFFSLGKEIVDSTKS